MTAGPVVAVLVDGSVAAPVAARHAARVAHDTGRALLAVVPHEAGADPGDAHALAARVGPALASTGVPVSVVACPVPVGGGARGAVAAVRAVLAGVDVALLACPAGPRPSDLVAALVAAPPADLLLVPAEATTRRRADAP